MSLIIKIYKGEQRLDFTVRFQEFFFFLPEKLFCKLPFEFYLLLLVQSRRGLLAALLVKSSFNRNNYTRPIKDRCVWNECP